MYSSLSQQSRAQSQSDMTMGIITDPSQSTINTGTTGDVAMSTGPITSPSRNWQPEERETADTSSALDHQMGAQNALAAYTSDGQRPSQKVSSKQPRK